MRVRLGNTELRVDPLMLLFPCVAALLGEGRHAALLLLSLAAHEGAHLIAARAAGIAMRSIRLTPFGGLAQMENPYAISAPRMIAVAAAGPAANLLMLTLSAALGQWSILSGAASLELALINASLMLFNLLPALPLDGGRILFAALSGALGRERALRAGIWAGRGVAVLLVALAGWGLLTRGRLNLSLLFAAVFLLASAPDERRALTEGTARTLIDSLRPLSEPTPADVVAIDADTPPQIALRAARPQRLTLFAVYQDGRLTRFTDERTLLRALAREHGAPHAPRAG